MSQGWKMNQLLWEAFCCLHQPLFVSLRLFLSVSFSSWKRINIKYLKVSNTLIYFSPRPLYPSVVMSTQRWTTWKRQTWQQRTAWGVLSAVIVEGLLWKRWGVGNFYTNTWRINSCYLGWGRRLPKQKAKVPWLVLFEKLLLYYWMLEHVRCKVQNSSFCKPS